jgi:hypothetical protein
MGIGDDGDFRMVGFQQVPLFPGQDHIGGGTSPILYEANHPLGGSNVSPPTSQSTTIALGNNNFTFPGTTLPNIPPPVIYVNAGGGATTPQLLVDGSPLTAPESVSQITFVGSGLVGVSVASGIATVEYQDTGGGGGGSTLVYGQITAATRTVGAITVWTYTVMRHVAGVPTTAVTAFNLLELANSTTVSYGYSVIASGNFDQITGTSFFIKSVPVNTWVQMENTSAIPGFPTTFWFSAPNRVDGAC